MTVPLPVHPLNTVPHTHLEGIETQPRLGSATLRSFSHQVEGPQVTQASV